MATPSEPGLVVGARGTGTGDGGETDGGGVDCLAAGARVPDVTVSLPHPATVRATVTAATSDALERGCLITMSPSGPDSTVTAMTSPGRARFPWAGRGSVGPRGQPRRARVTLVLMAPSGAALTALVLRAGDEVRASGRVVSHDGGAWLEAPVPVLVTPPSTGDVQSDEPARFAGFGVAVRGVDLAGLTAVRRGQHVVEGYAQLGGTWRGDLLEVSAQHPPGEPPRPARRLDVPPCPAPAGGWPRSARGGNLEPWPEWVRRRPDVVTMAAFRPSPTQVVLVVAAADPGPVERDLRPVYGPRLCVIRSRWSRRQLDSALRRIGGSGPRLGVYESGESVTESGQPSVDISAVRVTPALVDVVAALPSGLVDVHAWLVPERGV
jgi:hypothetical protein